MSTTQGLFTVVEPGVALWTPGFTAKNAGELASGLLGYSNNDGTVKVCTANLKPTGFVMDTRSLFYKPTDIYAAAGEPITLVQGEVMVECDENFFVGRTVPAAGAALYSAAAGLMDTTGTYAVGKVLLQESMRAIPNTTKTIVRIACLFSGKDI